MRQEIARHEVHPVNDERMMCEEAQPESKIVTTVMMLVLLRMMNVPVSVCENVCKSVGERDEKNENICFLWRESVNA